MFEAKRDFAPALAGVLFASALHIRGKGGVAVVSGGGSGGDNLGGLCGSRLFVRGCGFLSGGCSFLEPSGSRPGFSMFFSVFLLNTFRTYTFQPFVDFRMSFGSHCRTF